MNFKGRIPSIAALQRELGVKSYDKMRLIIAGKLQPSPHLAMRIEAATGGAIRKGELRPDIWPPEPLGEVS